MFKIALSRTFEKQKVKVVCQSLFQTVILIVHKSSYLDCLSSVCSASLRTWQVFFYRVALQPVAPVCVAARSYSVPGAGLSVCLG